jgi:type IV pilus assembly protein PilQ
LIVLLLGWAIGAAAESQLNGVAVSTQADSTVVALETAGAFTHREYRPQPSMVLVDLDKVSSSSLKPRERSLNLPGVKSYRVLEYRNVSGAEVTRVELTVAESAKLQQVRESKTGLELSFSNGAAGPAPQRSAQSTPPAKVPVTPAANSAPSAPKPTLASEHPPAIPASSAKSAVKGGAHVIKIRNVTVVRTSAGMAVQIEGVKSARTMRLSGPERLVLDVDDAISEGGARTIPVNAADLKEVRIAQHQLDPPVTRIVLDLTGPCEFDVANWENKLVVTVLPSKSASQLAAGPPVSAALAPPQVKAASPVSAMSPIVPPPPMTAAPLPALPPAKATASAPLMSDLFPPTVVKDSDPVKAEVRAEQPQLKPAVFEAHPGQPGSASKAPDFVVVEPSFTTQPAKAPVEAKSATPASPANATVASSGAANDKQEQLPVLMRPGQAATPAAASMSPAGARAAEAATTVAQSWPPESPAKPQQEPGASNSAAGMKQPAVNLALEQRRADATPSSPPTPARKYSGEPISVNLKDVDLKDFFRLIHEISGLNIVIDPGVKGTVTLVLDDVPWDQALEVVLHNNGLGRQLEGSVLRVATLETLRKETNEQRAHAEAQALAVNKVTVSRFLSYAHAKDLVPTFKKLLSPRGDVLADERTNALIISDIPSIIANLDRLITQLDRKTLEVEIEARVVAATRSFAREIGSQVGFGWGNGNGTAIGGVPAVGTSPNTVMDSGHGFPYFTIPGPSSGGSPTAQAIPLFSNLGVQGTPTSGLNFMTAVGNYRLDVMLTAAESRGLLKILSRPRVVTQNNITAVVRQGYRLPIVTAGQLGGPATTTYIDAFLRLTVTPQITVENTIFLAVDVENTVPDNSVSVQGNPGLATQQATTQVLVTDGGTVMIGGVIQTTNSVSVRQVPFLGNVPILGNVFKNRAVQTQTQELIFFLTPKIIQT